jgi:hypothetical protein
VSPRLCNVCRRAVIVDGVFFTTTLHFRADSGLSPFRVRMLLHFVRGKNRHAIATLCDPTSPFCCVAALGAKVFGGRIVSSTMDFASSVSRRINMNNIAIVIKLFFSCRAVILA